MRLKRDNNNLVLTLSAPESRLLGRVLARLAASYRLKPGEIDRPTASAWYSTRGCETAGASAAETAEWLEHLHAFKGGRIPKIEEWCRALTQAQTAAATLPISIGDATTFMTAINDYRLMTAAQHGIGEEEMAIQTTFSLARLAKGRQEALLEIHFLAVLIESVLEAIEG